MKIFVFYLKYYDAMEDREETEHGFISAPNLEGATASLEEMYPDLEEVRMTAFEGYDLGIIEKDALDKAQAWFQRMEQA